MVERNDSLSSKVGKLHITNQKKPSLSSERDEALRDFTSFYRIYSPLIRAVVFRMGVDNDLEDILQRVFIKAWKSLSKFKQNSSLKTWLTRIAINETLNYLKKVKRLPDSQTGLDDVKGKDDLSKKISNEEIVKKALAGLRLDHRSVLILHVVEGFSIKEISDILNIAEGTCKSKLSRARQKFKKELESLGVKA